MESGPLLFLKAEVVFLLAKDYLKSTLLRPLASVILMCFNLIYSLMPRASCWKSLVKLACNLNLSKSNMRLGFLRCI